MNSNVINLNTSLAGEEPDKGDAVVKIEVLNENTGRVKESFEISMPGELAQLFLERVWADVLTTMPNITVARLLDSRTGQIVTEISPKKDAPRALLPGPTMTLEGLFKPLSPNSPSQDNNENETSDQ